MTTTSAERESDGRSHVAWFPHTSLGRWGLGLMLLAAVAGPGWWVILQPSSPATDVVDDPDAWIRSALTVAAAVPAVIVGVAALVRRDARSPALVVASVVVPVEVAFAVFWVVAFGNGLLGLGVALGAAAAVLLGVLLARTLSPSSASSTGSR